MPIAIIEHDQDPHILGPPQEPLARISPVKPSYPDPNLSPLLLPPVYTLTNDIRTLLDMIHQHGILVNRVNMLLHLFDSLLRKLNVLFSHVVVDASFC